MDPITQQVVLAAAETAGAPGPGPGGSNFVDDLFSTFVYEGTGSAKTITNGINLSGEGGLVWSKKRNVSDFHILSDTERGVHKYLKSNDTDAEASDTGYITQFNSDGYEIGGGSNINYGEMVSWTFRKAPGFFDAVTYMGNGTAGRTVNHSLDSVPGMILIKRLNTTSDWAVYHKGEGNGYKLALNKTTNRVSTDYWHDKTPTATEFTLGDESDVNANKVPYIAYLFAHDDQRFGTNSDESVIKCGVYQGSNSAGNFVDVGFEPQWLMIKRATDSGHPRSWWIFDSIRGMPAGTGGNQLLADTPAAELPYNFLAPNADGFTLTTTDDNVNSQFTNYIYVAIRRPHKPPTDGTDVVKMQATESNNVSLTSLHAYPDLVLTRRRKTVDTAYNSAFVDRLRGNKQILTSSQSEPETNYSGAGTHIDLKLTGVEYPFQKIASGEMIFHSFKRTPGVFDIVAYTGTGSSRNLRHNLGAVPELIIQKRRSSPGDWLAFADVVTRPNSDWYLNFGNLDQSFALENNFGSAGISGPPTSTVIPLGNNTNLNGDSSTFVMYLFASLDGISKIGTYSGRRGNKFTIDCGFTAGARFVLIKRINGAGSWYLWDSTRGIVSNRDPYVLLDSTDVEVTDTDYVDYVYNGFKVTASAPAALNDFGGTYLFLAIA